MTLESRFNKIGLDEIHGYIRDKQEENLHLDFKTVKNSLLDFRDDRKNYANSLSGFANSSGGLIIWGIDARKNESGVNCAVETKPINDIDHFVSRLNELENDAVSPQIDGVRHKKIPLEDNKSCGFAITLVPESISGPHMAKLGEFRYYKRSGDSFYVMEHFDLEDMFGRRKKPKLELTTQVTGHNKQTGIILGISNTGRGSAKSPYLAFVLPKPFVVSQYGVDGNGAEGLKRLSGHGSKPWIEYGGNAQDVIHPGVVLEVAKLFLGMFGLIPDPPKEDISIKYRIAAEDMLLVEGVKFIPFG